MWRYKLNKLGKKTAQTDTADNLTLFTGQIHQTERQSPNGHHPAPNYNHSAEQFRMCKYVLMNDHGTRASQVDGFERDATIFCNKKNE